MKKSITLLTTCLMLTACIGHETNLEDAQAARDAQLYQKRAQEGCTFTRDQAAYRECLLNTYYSKHPQNYQTAELVNGQPISIVNSMTTYERNAVPQVAPLPVSEAQILSYTTSETTTMEGQVTKTTEAPVKAEVVVTEEITATKPVPPAPIVVEEPVIVDQPAPVVEKQPSWWDVHQEEGLVEPVKTKCPCDDPNDPCPQCYEK